MNTAAVRTTDLCFSYEPCRPVLDHVNLTVPDGAVCALLGPNGSGKTTLLHLILGLHQPDGGHIRLWEHPHLSPAERTRLVAIVPQNEQVAFALAVLDYVLLGRAPHLGLLGRPSARDHDLALDALATLGLEDLASRPVTGLSGGEFQLVILARALAQESALLLLDEPTAHLDLANAARVLEAVSRLRQTGRTVIFTTHDPNAAAAVADKVVLLRQGTVLAAGTPAHTLTAEHLRTVYGIDVTVLQHHNQPHIITNPPTGGPSWNN